MLVHLVTPVLHRLHIAVTDQHSFVDEYDALLEGVQQTIILLV